MSIFRYLKSSLASLKPPTQSTALTMQQKPSPENDNEQSSSPSTRSTTGPTFYKCLKPVAIRKERLNLIASPAMQNSSILSSSALTRSVSGHLHQRRLLVSRSKMSQPASISWISYLSVARRHTHVRPPNRMASSRKSGRVLRRSAQNCRDSI